MKIRFFRFAAALFSGAALLATGCTDYDVDIQKVDQKVDALATETNGRIASLEQQIAGINTTIATLETAANHKADIDNLKTVISNLETALKEDYQTKIQNAVADLTTEIGKKVDQAAYDLDKDRIEQAIRDVNEAIDAAKLRIKALEDADFQKQINDLHAALDARLDMLEALLAGDWKGKTVKETIDAVAMTVADLETVLNGKIAALDERLTRAEGAIKTINEETIPALRAEIENIKNGKLDKATFDAYKVATAATLDLYHQSIESLVDLTAGFPDNKTIKEYIDGLAASLAAGGVLQSTFDEFVKIAVTQAELAAVKAELEGRIHVCEDLLAGDWGGQTVQQYIDAQAQALENLRAQFNDRLRKVENLLAGDWGGRTVQQYIQSLLAAVKAELEGRISVCEDLLAGDWGGNTVQQYIAEMLSRVQSVVFAPKFDDGKMTVSGSGSAVNSFKVMPEEAAAALVSLFAWDPAAFGFDVTTIVTRAGDEAALKLSVTDVKLNAAHGDKGWVDVSVSSNFGALSAAEKAKTYSAALVIKVKQNGAALSSPFYTVCLPD